MEKDIRKSTTCLSNLIAVQYFQSGNVTSLILELQAKIGQNPTLPCSKMPPTP